jgi:hypothetical protein
VSELAERKRIASKLVEPPRCSDFDTDCSHVMDHAACHRGGTFITGCCGEEVELEPADGYCPYLGIPGGNDGRG